MFRNYLRITLRNLTKHRGYSFINIAGLAIGMACCLMILLYVSDELSFDHHHKNADRIYRVNAISSIGETTRHYATTPPALGPEIALAIPEIEKAVRFFDIFELEGRIKDKHIRIPNTCWVDPTYFQIFSHRFIAGDPRRALAIPESIVLTEETAERLFGGHEALNQVITFPGSRTGKVTGVIQNFPKNSHFRFNALIPTTAIRDQEGRPHPVLRHSYFCQLYTYVLLKENTDLNNLNQKIMTIHESKWGKMFKQRGTERQYPLISMRDIHLKSHYEYEIGNQGDINNIYLFSGIALLVLMIACFNFINLSTARSTGRAREVGVRKVFGSGRHKLIKQFLGESVIVSLISLVFGILMVTVALPVFNSLSGKEFTEGQLLKLPFLLGLLGIIIFTGFIAGSFPAFILSAFHPVTVLKGKFSSASKNSSLRKILVITQFAISVFMIVGILVMIRQLDYIKNKELGFNKDQLVVTQFFGHREEEEEAKRFDALKDRLLKNPSISSVTFSANIPGGDLGYDAYLPEGESDDNTVRAINYIVDHDFIKTYEMELVVGRDFSKEFSTDAGEAIIISEKMAGILGWGEDCLGKQIINVARDNRKGKIVGIIKDFHSGSLKTEISPVILSLDPQFFSFVTARIQPSNVSSTLKFLEKELRKVSHVAFPEREFTFDYYFVDDDFRNKYTEEERVREIYIIFGILAVFVACLGLFGLASFTLEQRTKEIGVRKVLGASGSKIFLLLSKEYAKLIIIANILAWPLAYYAMSRWLENFAYRVRIGVDIFIFSFILAFIVASLTIFYHSLKAILANPVDSLRYE